MKSPIYEPFDRSGGGAGVIGLEFFEPDFQCLSEEDYGESENSLDEMELDELEVMKSSLEDGIFNYDTIIEIQVAEHKPSESLTNDRRHRQQLIVELREVKKRIKMMKNELKEATVA